MKLLHISGKYGSAIGNYAQVDDDIYAHLTKWKWHISKLKDGTFGYVRRTIAEPDTVKKQKFSAITLHREVMQVTDPKVHVDHIDGNRLNNQKVNLRLCTRSQNGANRKKSKSAFRSKYIGVSVGIYKGKKKESVYWRAFCKKDGKTYMTTCKDELSAALSYNEMALKYHGEFAKLNDIDNN